MTLPPRVPGDGQHLATRLPGQTWLKHCPARAHGLLCSPPIQAREPPLSMCCQRSARPPPRVTADGLSGGVVSAFEGAKSPDVLTQLPGFGSVSPKLAKKIMAQEFVDMWELLPETWRLEAEGSCCQTRHPRHALVTDISIWTECYSTMAAILASVYPDKAPHFFAYLRTITKASLTFENAAWASYDVAYRRQAANRGSLDWGVVDAALYNEAFTGRARSIPRCWYCLADTHSSRECAHAPVEGGTPNGPYYTAEPRYGRPLTRQTALFNRGSNADICRLFNSPGGSRCRFPQCRYRAPMSEMQAATSPEQVRGKTPARKPPSVTTESLFPSLAGERGMTKLIAITS